MLAYWKHLKGGCILGCDSYRRDRRRAQEFGIEAVGWRQALLRQADSDQKRNNHMHRRLRASTSVTYREHKRVLAEPDPPPFPAVTAADLNQPDSSGVPVGQKVGCGSCLASIHRVNRGSAGRVNAEGAL